MELAAGTLGRPGIVIIAPQTTTINFAPVDSLTSLTDKVWPDGAPFNLGSVEITLGAIRIILNDELVGGLISRNNCQYF